MARFDPNGPRGPRLVGEHVVRPGNGHWYETQWWAPDGSGFLYTETTGTAINPELFFCRLPDPARGRCRPSRLTRNPAWDEQAIFTPDMDRMIFMSSRGLRGAYNDWSRVARFLELPAHYDYLLVLSVFSDSFLQPVLGQATDLWSSELRWSGGPRPRAPARPRRSGSRRTGERGWIVPEFAWDPAGRRLLWTREPLPAGRARGPELCDAADPRRGHRQAHRRRHHRRDPVGPRQRDPRPVAELLRDPSGYARREPGCGGSRPATPGVFDQRTRIGRAAGAPGRESCVRAALFITCMGDTLFPGTGRAVVEVLERLGHQVDFPEEQTCCGQMHANSGYQLEAVPLVRRFVHMFGDAEVVVSPSASCVGMVRDQYTDIARLAGDPGLEREVQALLPRVVELSEFLVDRLGSRTWAPPSRTR